MSTARSPDTEHSSSIAWLRLTRTRFGNDWTGRLGHPRRTKANSDGSVAVPVARVRAMAAATDSPASWSARTCRTASTVASG